MNQPPAKHLTPDLGCEVYKSSNGYHVTTCGKPSSFAKTNGSRPVEAICAFHASILLRSRYSAAEVIELTPEVMAPIRERLAEVARLRAEEKAAKRAEAEVRHAARVEREWTELASERYELTLVIEEGWTPGEVREVAIRVHEVGNPNDWDAYSVELKNDGPDLPVYVNVRNASNMNPAAAVLIAEAITVASGWADELNVR